MATPVLLASYEVLSAASDTSSLVTPSFTPSDGEVLIVKVASETVNTPTIGLATGGGQTYTSRISINVANHCPIRLFTATVSGSPGSMTVTVPFTVNSGFHSLVVERWGNAQLAASPAINSATPSNSAPSLTINTVLSDSVVSWLSADWNANAPGTPVYRSSAIQTGIHDKSAAVAYVAYFAYQVCGAAGTQTFGLSAPGNQEATMGAIEVQGLGVNPSVATQAVTNITAATATGNGNVTSDGGQAITERGVCWSTSVNPTTSDSKATSAGTTGTFTASLTGLSSATLYHVRAYAINSIGTSYGDDVTFIHYPVALSWISA